MDSGRFLNAGGYDKVNNEYIGSMHGALFNENSNKKRKKIISQTAKFLSTPEMLREAAGRQHNKNR